MKTLWAAPVAFLLLAVSACAGASAPAKPAVQPGIPGLPTESVSGGRLGILDSNVTVPCYTRAGGRGIVAASGCTITIEDGAALAIEDGAAVTGAVTNSLKGAALKLDPGETTKIQATADYQPILTIGGTPTAAALTINDSAGTPIAKFRGGAGGIDIMGSLLAASGQTLRGHLVVGTSTPAVVVASTPLAPGGAAQPISIATAGTVPLTIPTAGARICVWNTSTEAITIQDTGNQVLTADAVLGQYDVLCGFSDGTRFIETSRANN